MALREIVMAELYLSQEAAAKSMRRDDSSHWNHYEYRQSIHHSSYNMNGDP